MLSTATTLCRQSLNGDDITQGDRRKTTSPSVPVSVFLPVTITPNVIWRLMTFDSLDGNTWKLNLITCKAVTNCSCLYDLVNEKI